MGCPSEMFIQYSRSTFYKCWHIYRRSTFLSNTATPLECPVILDGTTMITTLHNDHTREPYAIQFLITSFACTLVYNAPCLAISHSGPTNFGIQDVDALYILLALTK